MCGVGAGGEWQEQFFSKGVIRLGVAAVNFTRRNELTLGLYYFERLVSAGKAIIRL